MRETSKTNEKGDNGLFKVMTDLNIRGVHISIPVSTHLPYDLIADYNSKLIRVQVKYSGDKNGYFNGKKAYMSKDGPISWHYEIEDFELYAVYLKAIDKCVYVPNLRQMASMRIRTELPRTYAKFYWWEDFLDLNSTEIPKKRSIKDFIERPLIPRSTKFGQRKIENRPSIEELKSLLTENSFVSVGKMYGISDSAVRKWVKSYGLKIKRHARKANKFENEIE